MATTQSALRPAASHIHVSGLQCPVCDQPIPNEKVDQVRTRMEARERELSETLTARLREQFAVERVQFEANARAREATAREEGSKTAQTAAQQRIEALAKTNADLQAAAHEKVVQAERDKAAAVSRSDALQTSHETIVGQRVQEAREALEKEKSAALNAKDAKHFEENQKLKDKLDEALRKLEKKTAEELGEGAEIKLLDELKVEFPGDRIEDIGRNKPGADIRHVVIHNGKECGVILYDSKNRGAWRNDYVDKLAKDQRAGKADHAILASRAFPQHTSQLHINNDIIIANPARVVAVVQIIRNHIVHTHALRLSNTERAKKTVALYGFITSRRCTQLLDAFDAHADDLLELQKKEIKAHEANWKQQGMLCRSIQKVRADLVSEIDRIIEATD